MWKILGNIFSSIDVKDIIARGDEMNLTREESIKYQLEWLKTIPTGFQMAQRFIGIAFSAVFLLMILVTFFVLVFGGEVDDLILFIENTMVNPIMIIFSLFFGGGVVDSFRRKHLNPNTTSSNELREPIDKEPEPKPMSRGQKRRANKRKRELNDSDQ